MTVMTHGGSGLGHCESDLKKLCKGASFGKGIAIQGTDAAKSEDKVAVFAKQAVK